MKRLLTFVFSLGVLSISAQTLTPKWTTEATLSVPESVLLDSKNNVLYVSSIGGTPDAKDGDGFISQVTLDGKIKNLKWATGIRCSKRHGLIQ